MVQRFIYLHASDPFARILSQTGPIQKKSTGESLYYYQAKKSPVSVKKQGFFTAGGIRPPPESDQV